MSTVQVNLVLCACGQPESAAVHHGENGHRYSPIRGVDQIRDDQHLDKALRRGHYSVSNYRVISIPQPAAGAEVLATVPATATWRVQCLQMQLVTSAAVPNRIPHLVVKDSLGVSVYNFPSPQNQGATTTFQYSAGTTVVSLFFDNAAVLVLPYPMKLGANWSIGTLTTGLDVADQYSKIALHVKEWLRF
jgi:hypothetical protein